MIVPLLVSDDEGDASFPRIDFHPESGARMVRGAAGVAAAGAGIVVEGATGIAAEAGITGGTSATFTAGTFTAGGVNPGVNPGAGALACGAPG